MSAAIDTWIIVADDAAVGGLIEFARMRAGRLVAVVAGRKSVADEVATAGVDRVIWLGQPPEATPVEAFAPEVARLVGEGLPRAVLGPDTTAGRALLGAVAVRCGGPVFTRVSALELDGDRVVLTRILFGGIAECRESVDGGPAILALPSGGHVIATGIPTPVEQVEASPMTNAEVVDRRSAELVSVDLPSAPMVVGIGRGLKAQADLTLIEELATALGAELGCSRPLAEGVDWMPKERYIGISGQHIAPRLYMAVGISGQLQHMFGARDSEVIVAVNSDADAPIFAECDYGLVGDLYRIVPALVAALKTPR
jgi:electron transfer flavoprotein alpha subunit